MPSSIRPTSPYSQGGRETGRDAEIRGWRQRTNALDFNKELSQQIAWPYINRAEDMGDLPTGPEHSHAPLGLPQDSESQNKTPEHNYTVQPRQTLYVCADPVNQNHLNVT